MNNAYLELSHVSEDYVVKELERLSSRKSTGVDEVRGFFKMVQIYIKKRLLHMYLIYLFLVVLYCP